jgi:hypothetical protein
MSVRLFVWECKSMPSVLLFPFKPIVFWRLLKWPVLNCGKMYWDGKSDYHDENYWPVDRRPNQCYLDMEWWNSVVCWFAMCDYSHIHNARILCFLQIHSNIPFVSRLDMPAYSAATAVSTEHIVFASSLRKTQFQSITQSACGFFRDNPNVRIGYGSKGLDNLKKHKWFDGFNWIGLEEGKLVAPLVPTVSVWDNNGSIMNSSKSVWEVTELTGWT